MKSKVYLLDANVLIALSTPDHILNARAAGWFRQNPRFATCPITEGSLVRFHLRMSPGATSKSASILLANFSAHPSHEFWPDDLSYGDIPDLRITGHQQVTDAYLASLAKSHGGILATMDKALAALHPIAFLIP